MGIDLYLFRLLCSNLQGPNNQRPDDPGAAGLDPALHEVFSYLESRQPPLPKVVDSFNECFQRRSHGGLRRPRFELHGGTRGYPTKLLVVRHPQVEPPGPPGPARGGALERDVLLPHPIPEPKSGASRDPVLFHKTELVEVAEKVEEGDNSDKGFAEMCENTKERNGVGIEVKEMDTIKIQDQHQEFGGRRQEPASNKMCPKSGSGDSPPAAWGILSAEGIDPSASNR